MGHCSVLLFLVGVAAASFLTMDNRLTSEDDKLVGYDQGQDPSQGQGQSESQGQDYSGSMDIDEENYSTHPPFRIPKNYRQRCHTFLLTSLQSMCPKKAAIVKRYDRGISRLETPHPRPHPEYSARTENVVDACCKKSCGIMKLLTFCPHATPTTTEMPISPPILVMNPPKEVEIVRNETTKERQSPFLPFLVALLALGLPKKSKEVPSREVEVDGETDQNLQPGGRRETLEIDVILEREVFDEPADSSVNVAQLSPAPTPPSESVSNGYGNKVVFGESSFRPVRQREDKGHGSGRRRRPSSSGRGGESSIRDTDPQIQIGTHRGTLDEIRH